MRARDFYELQQRPIHGQCEPLQCGALGLPAGAANACDRSEPIPLWQHGLKGNGSGASLSATITFW